MKFRLGCILFGHVFHYEEVGSREGLMRHQYTDNCVKCGLTKQEIGI